MLSFIRVSPFRKKKFFAYKRNKANLIRFTCVSLFHYKISILFFRFFSLFSLFFAFSRFFRFFCFKFSLRFDLVIFALKRNKAFFTFFRFFSLFSLFLLNFHFASIFSLNFRLFYLRFRFRFLVFCIEVNHVKSGFFSLRSEMKFSLQFKISLPKRK
jgi:hypothetical protein